MVTSVVSALTSSSARAQVNAETLRVALRDHPTFLWLDGALVTRAGNSQGATVAASAFGGITRLPHLVFGKASADYATTTNATLIVARSLAHVRYNYETTQRLSLEVLTQVQHDYFRRLAVRDLYGTGLRFNVARTKNFELFAGTTMLLEHQIIAATSAHRGESDLGARSSNYAGANMALGEHVEVNSVTYVQPRLARPKDFRVLHETIVTLAITKRLAAKIAANVTYDREPPAGVLPADVEVKNSLAVKF